MQASDDLCVVTPYVLLPLMVCQLSCSSFEKYFSKLTSVFTAAASVTVEECDVSSRRQGVWGCCHVLILSTALTFNVPPLFSWNKNPRASTWSCLPAV